MSESILPGRRLVNPRHKSQWFIRYVPLFHPCFWFVLSQSTLLSVFVLFRMVFSCKCIIVCLYSCTHDRLYFNFVFVHFPKQHLNPFDFLQSSLLWKARCALIGQLSSVLWLAECLKHDGNIMPLRASMRQTNKNPLQTNNYQNLHINCYLQKLKG